MVMTMKINDNEFDNNGNAVNDDNNNGYVMTGSFNDNVTWRLVMRASSDVILAMKQSGVTCDRTVCGIVNVMDRYMTVCD